MKKQSPIDSVWDTTSTEDLLDVYELEQFYEEALHQYDGYEIPTTKRKHKDRYRHEE